MVSSVSSTSTKTPTPTPPVTPAVAAANKTLNLLLQSSDMTQALAAKSSSYIPPTADQIYSTLWAMFNTTGSHTINKADVQQAVIAEGGNPGDATALWTQLDPTGAASVNAEDFVTNKYLTQAVPADLKSVQTAVAAYQQKQGPSASTNLLDSFMSDGGTGSIISDVGEGSADLDIFV